MPPPDPSVLRSALLTTLNADAALRTTIPNGAHWEQGPSGSRRHVIASMMDATHHRAFGARALHDNVYLVKAVVLSTEPNASSLARTAAAQIDALLEGGTLGDLNGFTLAALYLDPDLDIVDAVEVDDVDPTIRWYHRGGYYRVVAST